MHDDGKVAWSSDRSRKLVDSISPVHRKQRVKAGSRARL